MIICGSGVSCRNHGLSLSWNSIESYAHSHSVGSSLGQCVLAPKAAGGHVLSKCLLMNNLLEWSERTNSGVKRSSSIHWENRPLTQIDYYLFVSLSLEIHCGWGVNSWP